MSALLAMFVAIGLSLCVRYFHFDAQYITFYFLILIWIDVVKLKNGVK